MEELRQEARNALELEGRRLILHMRREIERTTDGGAPGKPAWRKEISEGLRKVSETVGSDAVSVEIGYEAKNTAAAVRANIVNEGSGSVVGNPPIHAGPTGRNVWDSDLSGQHPSKAKSEYLLPASFNQKGNQFLENAMRLMQTEFGEMTEVVFSTLPPDTFYGHVEVSQN